jgi:peptide-methionine (R)-S-oxide reductase
MQLSDEEWRRKLTPEQYRVLREQGTEAPFSGDLVNEDRDGVYTCAACGTELFRSQDKYESRMPGLAGWPSFADVITAGKVELRDDTSHGMQRTEVVCKNCGSHLGHVFDGDTDSPTGQHYCINSVCLQFKPGSDGGND